MATHQHNQCLNNKEPMATASNPTEHSLTSLIREATISETVLPTSTGFTMSFGGISTLTEPERTQSTLFSTSIPAEEQTSANVIDATNNPSDSSLTKSIETIITSDTVQPFEQLLPPPHSLPRPLLQTQITELATAPSTPSSTKQILKEALEIRHSETYATFNDSKPSTTSDTTVAPSRSDQIQPITTKTMTGTHSSNQVASSNLSPGRESSLMDSVMSRPKDWAFNAFLDELSLKITNEELSRLKHYVIGEGGFGDGVLEKIKTALEFFTALRRRRILTRDNITFLQAMLWRLKRLDLHTMCVEHARNFGNVLYFYAPSPEPENGYKHVKFHVDKCDLKDFDRTNLETIRTVVAELLLVPPEFVLVNGLEPSSSLIITFMMPEYYASLLIEMVVANRTPELLDVGIDTIYYHEKPYHLLGKRNENGIPGKFPGNFEDCKKHLERLQRTETWLEQREKEVIELSRLLDKAKLDLPKARGEDADKKPFEIPTLQTQTAFAYLESSMEKARESGQCTEDVMKLLEANTYFITSKTKDECRHEIRKLRNKVEELQLAISKLKFRNLMSKWTTVDVSDIESHLPELSLRNVHGLSSGLDDLGICFLMIIRLAAEKKRSEMLRKLSSQLTTEEQVKIRIGLASDWTPEEICHVEEDPGDFLEMAVKKENQRQGVSSTVNILSFIAPLFKHVNRSDLTERLIEECNIVKEGRDLILDLPLATRYRTESTNQRTSTESPHGIKDNQFDEIQNSLRRLEDMLKKLMSHAFTGRNEVRDVDLVAQIFSEKALELLSISPTVLHPMGMLNNLVLETCLRKRPANVES